MVILTVIVYLNWTGLKMFQFYGNGDFCSFIRENSASRILFRVD